jgi:Skp family chaperone for outer membrane proteins
MNPWTPLIVVASLGAIAGYLAFLSLFETREGKLGVVTTTLGLFIYIYSITNPDIFFDALPFIAGVALLTVGAIAYINIAPIIEKWDEAERQEKAEAKEREERNAEWERKRPAREAKEWALAEAQREREERNAEWERERPAREAAERERQARRIAAEENRRAALRAKVANLVDEADPDTPMF